MDKESVKNHTSFFQFQNETRNEISQRDLPLQDVPNDEQSISEYFVHDEIYSTTINQDTSAVNESNCCGTLIRGFDDAFETIYGDSEINYVQVQQISEELHVNCVRMLNLVKSQKRSIEIKDQRSGSTLLENESLSNTINNLQCQITELNLQLQQQSTFSSVVGSNFSYYLWKATQMPVVVDMVLEESKIISMAKLMANILTSFIETYYKMPSIKTYETKFVLNILGIIANLTTSESGRRFFSQVNDGTNIVHLIISLVVCTPSLESNIKKMAYAVLYNVSIQFDGHLLMENRALINTLQNDVKVSCIKDINDTLIFALQLLHSLTKSAKSCPSASMSVIIKSEINVQEILKLTKYTPTELIARKICENLNVACKEYNDEIEKL